MKRSKIVDKITAIVFVSVLAVISIIAVVLSFTVGNSNDANVNDIYLGVGQVYTYPVKNKLTITKSYNEDIVTIDKKGDITAVAKGEGEIKVGSKKIKVIVSDAPEGVELNEEELILGIGESYEEIAKVPNNENFKFFTYASSDENIVKIDDNGNLTAVAEGVATITVSTYNDFHDECTVTVKKAPESVAFKYDKEELFEGASLVPVLEFSENSTSMNNTFASDNDKVVTVDKDGNITAVAEGTATITVTTFNGKTATCTVVVSSKPSYIRTDLDKSKPMIAFTFDDGPNASSTNIVLDTLQKNGASATFFMVGARTKSSANADCVKRMVSMGCQLGNHTYDHTHYGKEVTVEDISKCSDAIYDITGLKPTAFRPTGGAISDLIKENANAPIYIWSVDTLDWKHRDTDRIYKTVMNNVKDGDIVLMHDIYSTTAAAVERLVPELVSQGYQIVNVAELAYYHGIEPQNGNIYYSFK